MDRKAFAAMLPRVNEAWTRTTMPQLWLTYHEMAEAFGGEPEDARAVAIARALTRKHSTDGLTRVLMPPELLQAYFRTRAWDASPVDPAEVPLVLLRQALARMPRKDASETRTPRQGR